MFANAQLARAAAEKEIEEARARTVAQRALADAQAQAAQRALTVAREKAANEAKSEFMSLMCHEVRVTDLCRGTWAVIRQGYGKEGDSNFQWRGLCPLKGVWACPTR